MGKIKVDRFILFFVFFVVFISMISCSSINKGKIFYQGEHLYIKNKSKKRVIVFTVECEGKMNKYTEVIVLYPGEIKWLNTEKKPKITGAVKRKGEKE